MTRWPAGSVLDTDTGPPRMKTTGGEQLFSSGFFSPKTAKLLK